MSNPRVGSSQMMISPRGMNGLPADVNQAQPNFGGANDGAPCALSVDNNGNLRITLNGSNIVGGGSVPVLDQNGLADSLTAAGAVAAPGAGAAIATLAIPAGAAVYDVTIFTALPIGAPVNADAANMVFKNNGAAVGNALACDGTITRLGRVTTVGGINFTVNAIAAGTAGVTYLASITAIRIA